MKKKLLLVSPAVIFAAVAVPATAFAAKCKNVDTSFDYNCSAGGTAGGVTSLIITVINFMAVGVGIAVVGGIVWGSLWYITANGNAGKAQQGISIVINAVLGLLLFAFMWAMINFLVPGGVFS